MRFPWRRAELARTCAECGYTWRVPRSAGRRRFRSISAFDVSPNTRMLDRANLARQVAAISAQNKVFDTYHRCPKCDSEHFTQHAARGKPSG